MILSPVSKIPARREVFPATARRLLEMRIYPTVVARSRQARCNRELAVRRAAIRSGGRRRDCKLRIGKCELQNERQHGPRPPSSPFAIRNSQLPIRNSSSEHHSHHPTSRSFTRPSICERLRCRRSVCAARLTVRCRRRPRSGRRCDSRVGQSSSCRLPRGARAALPPE